MASLFLWAMGLNDSRTGGGTDTRDGCRLAALARSRTHLSLTATCEACFYCTVVLQIIS